jgi:hypothetical protein
MGFLRKGEPSVAVDENAEPPRPSAAHERNAPPPPPPKPAGGSHKPFAPLLPWVLFALALAAGTGFGILWWGLHSREAMRDDVRNVATKASLALTEFSYKSIRADVNQIEAVATGDFEKQVKDLFSGETIASIEKVKAQSSAKIESVFVQSITGETATAFAVVQETITNKLSKGPQTQTVRMQIDLVDTSRGWKADQVTLFQTPTQPGLGGGGALP